MKIDQILIYNEGYVHCHSKFYSSHDIIASKDIYNFDKGINIVHGDIDSGIWAISYLLSMYCHSPEDFVIFKQPIAIVNNQHMPLEEFAKYSCYMDCSYPLFSLNDPVNLVVKKLIISNELDYSPDDIRNLFEIDKERFGRPLLGLGNNIYRAMAAIGYCQGKQVFCFPWFSNVRYRILEENLLNVCEQLSSLNMIAILPIGV